MEHHSRTLVAPVVEERDIAEIQARPLPGAPYIACRNADTGELVVLPCRHSVVGTGDLLRRLGQSRYCDGVDGEVEYEQMEKGHNDFYPG